MNYEDLVSQIAMALVSAALNGADEKGQARAIVEDIRRSRLLIVPDEASAGTSRMVAPTMSKGMSTSDCEKIAPQVYADMVRMEDIIRK